MSPRCDLSVAQGASSKQWLYLLAISRGVPASWISIMRIVGDRRPTQQKTRRRGNDNDYRHSGTERESADRAPDDEGVAQAEG